MLGRAMPSALAAFAVPYRLEANLGIMPGRSYLKLSQIAIYRIVVARFIGAPVRLGALS